MRVTIVFLGVALVACAQRDQRPVVVAQQQASAPTDTLVPIPESEPITRWTPPPAAPGDTTPKGSPNEHALLRWVHLLHPDTFPELPKVVRDSLVTRHCQIPVPGSGRANVVTGAFSTKGAVEWAG